MIEIEGYKAFRGILSVEAKVAPFAFSKTGSFLYRPDTDCWYDEWSSYPAKICEVKKDFDDDVQV